MQSKAKLSETAGSGAFVGHGARDLEERIARFERPRRARIRRLVALSPRVADLAHVFPGALHVLASRQGTTKSGLKALDLVCSGAQLRDVAAALKLPLWLRRLPPEAFSGPVPPLPLSEIFARRIANHFPLPQEDSELWLRAVAFGVRACDEHFALWLAQQPVYGEAGDPEHLFGLLAAYAWFSNNQISRKGSLIGVPWRPEIALDTAACAAKSWLNRMRLLLQLGRGAIVDSWLEPGEARGFTFVPLLEHDAILSEAQAMQNCADQYADRLARDRCRLFSVRRRGLRIATLEIGPHPREAGVLAIAQLKARHNLPAPSDIWQAAHTWLGGQAQLKRSLAGSPPERRFDAAAWAALTADYRLQKHGAPWLPDVASKESFASMEGGIAELARRAGITSWLFT